MSIARPVYITYESGTWFVRYRDREKWQRHTAAQFDARHSTREWVEGWVTKQPGIILTVPPKEQQPHP